MNALRAVSCAAACEPAPLAIDVVSVQSQVIYGRVGNNVAVPTLEAAGYQVACVPSVLLSNTPHYPSIYGGAIPSEWFSGYLCALNERNALHDLKGILLGYLGSTTQAALLGRWIAGLKHQGRTLEICIDPVIGDYDTGVYVDPQMINAYRKHLLGKATGLTPNGFELACLTGLPTHTLEQVQVAARVLLVNNVRWVVVTSAAPAEWPEEQMLVAVVTRDAFEVIPHRRLSVNPKGTGDLFSACLLAGLLAGQALPEAVRKACTRVIEAVKTTMDSGSAELRLSPDSQTGRIGICTPIV